MFHVLAIAKVGGAKMTNWHVVGIAFGAVVVAKVIVGALKKYVGLSL